MIRKTLIPTLIAAVLTMSFLSIAHAEPKPRSAHMVGYGTFNSANIDGNWVVINDQGMYYGPKLKIVGRNGRKTDDVATIKAGSTVEYRYYIENQVWYINKLKVIKKLPAGISKTGVSIR